MATVYLAEDVPHGRDVAVKVLSPELGSSIDAERFRREIQIAARLSHPNILPAYDSGSADGLLYYVMPFVRGRVAARAARPRVAAADRGRDRDRRARSPTRSSTRTRRASSTATSSRRTSCIQSGHAMVADFGIARLVQASGDEKLTATGMSVGTPDVHESRAVLRRAGGRPQRHVQRWGACSTRCSSGRRRSPGRTRWRSWRAHTMQPVPSNPHGARERCRRTIEAAIMHALEKVPADRFASDDGFQGCTARRPRGQRRSFAAHAGLYVRVTGRATTAVTALDSASQHDRLDARGDRDRRGSRERARGVGAAARRCRGRRERGRGSCATWACCTSTTTAATARCGTWPMD